MSLARIFESLRLSGGYDYRLEGKRYIAGYDEERVGEILWAIEKRSHQIGSLGWLLRLRPLIREVESLNTRTFLSYVISTATDRSFLRIAIWLRGRCGGYVGSTVIARLAFDRDDSIRKEVARCLQRLSAWPALRQMATNDPSPRIRAMARQPAMSSHAHRQSRFLENVEALKASSADTPLQIAASVTFTEGRPARPAWVIRQILARIHALVTGA